MHVLYVDDYEPMCELVAELLGDEGFQVTVMSDAAAALQACAAPRAFDVAVVDYNMPQFDGEAFARSVAAGGLPVILVSGQVDPERQALAKAAGALAMVDKRVMLQDLPGMLQSLAGGG
jgi:CheY-like chemotaxis protein